ncbi:hypothetical protein L3X38_035425 [Prunus dulcis]|uniref:F-box domain-containing protein n=1 Tax=Prunus dulcis TaxID=3755 RepID=A0AAD4VKP5_PRUDU|nr:hypothetical protein L3X38_035425 [Prunus dulcis]
MVDPIFSKLSEELMTHILSRLPPKSLLRFKCIRKSWSVLITTPQFVEMHLSNFSSTRHQISTPSTTILFKHFILTDLNTDQKELLFSMFNLRSDDVDNDDMDGGDDHLRPVFEDLEVSCFRGVDTGGEFYRVGVDISSHCDGIVCLTDFHKKVALCNPAIREFKLLPESDVLLSSPEEVAILGVGLGRDLKHSKNYKVVRLVTYGDKKVDDDRFVVHPPRAEVFTLQGSDSWKEIEIGNIVTKTGFFLPQHAVSVYCKGVVYWPATDKDREYVVSYNYTDDEYDYCEENEGEDEEDNPENNERRAREEEERKERDMKAGILSFDFGEEVFDIIPYPPDVGYYESKIFGVWKESVAIFIYASMPDCFDIWVMDESEEKGSWTKYLTFEPEKPLFPLALWKSEEVVMVARDDVVLIFYNLETRKFKYLPLNGVFFDRTEAVVCASTLVSIQGDKQTQ